MGPQRILLWLFGVNVVFDAALAVAYFLGGSAIVGLLWATAAALWAVSFLLAMRRA